MPVGAKLARFTVDDVSSPERMVVKLNEMVTTLELRLGRLEGPLVDPRSPAGGEEVYAVTNVTEKRAFDADGVTLPELADVVGTFFEDLVNDGKLR